MLEGAAEKKIGSVKEIRIDMTNIVWEREWICFRNVF
jgi:hypothetical protein